MTDAPLMLDRPQGRIAYEVSGSGPLLVLVPGMGDLRSTYRFLVPPLVEAGYRVAAMDLRGHGDSDITFTSFGDAVTGQDVLSLIAELGGPAVVIGNSMGAGSGAWAAAERPDLIRGLVLVGPFVRDGAISWLQKLMFRLLMVPLWAASSWNAYLPRLYAGRKPADFDTYRATVAANVKRPGYRAAFAATTHISHDEANERLQDISCPVLVVMGELDPDFPDPAAEATWIANTLSGSVVMVPEAGHYPQSQRPDIVVSAVVGFLSKVDADV